MAKHGIISVVLASGMLFGAQAVGGETVLLDFYANWCGPCRSMMPIVEQLEEQGWPVRRIDVDRNPELASRFGVDALPTFVMIVDGRESDRVVGSTSRERLLSMLQTAKQPSAPEPSGPGTVVPLTAVAVSAETAPRAGASSREPTGAAGAVRIARGTPEDLLAATVRIHVQDPNGRSHGSGTIIDARSGEALIATCGHLFRDNGGRGDITVDLFGPRPATGLPGTLIGYTYDQTHDTALIAVKIDSPVVVARVAPPGYQPKVGDPVFNVGCDDGAPPTVKTGRVTAIDKYAGFGNIEASGAPVEGRSGGGLFSAEGYLIGICNAADPSENEGLYASLVEIYRELDQASLGFVYAGPGPEAARLADGGTAHGADTPEIASAPLVPLAAGNGPSGFETASSAVPQLPRRMPQGSIAETPSSTASQAQPAAERTPEEVTLAGGLPLPLPQYDAVPASTGETVPFGALSKNAVRPVGYVRNPEGQSNASAGSSTLTAREQAALEEIRRRQAAGYEVICIVRPKSDPQAESDVIVLENVSQAFVNQLVSGRPVPAGATEATGSSENRVADRRGSAEVPAKRAGGATPSNGLPPIPAAILPVAP
ncbi:hypothetical protein JCM19992_09540 [Thermostilla marina]